MNKNYMIEVAKMLGVELGEEFKVKDGYGGVHVCELNSRGLAILESDEEEAALPAYLLQGLLAGNRELIKQPWRPKNGDTYWCISVSGNIRRNTYRKDSMLSNALRCMGNSFRTEAEAEAHKDEIMAKFAEVR